MTQVAFGCALAALVAFAAYRARALDRSGAFAAFAIGAAIFGAGGWYAALVLFAFFVPSMLLSRLGRERKRDLTDIAKPGARDARQVLANGGVAAIAIVLARFLGAPLAAVLAAAYAGAFAAAAADTWGTEIGTWIGGRPRSILTLRPLAAGLSGGLSPAGTAAQVVGAASVGLVAQAVHLAPFWPVAIAGFIGATIDSLLGAGVQALRHCPRCKRDCENNPHVCGSPTTLLRGVAWFENDAVNFAATLGGAVFAALFATH
ncbi:MAG: DUF92 domain-containing protein [Vulcanimicrobiaceae bacterium]